MEKALSLSVDRNGLYDLIAINGAFPAEAKKEIFETGAVVVTYMLNLYDLNNNMSLSDLHISKESVFTYYSGYCLRRDTAWKASLDKSIR